MKKNKVSKLIAVTLVLALVIALAGCGTQQASVPEAGSKTEVVDQAGRTVAVPEEVSRVVALDTGLCGIILALGAWDTVVGTTKYTVLDDLLMEVIPDLDKVPTPGTSTEINLESLVALNPDVAIGGWQLDFIKQIEAAGIPSVFVEPVTFADEFAEIRLMGEILGRQEQAGQLEDWMQNKLDLVRERVADVPEAERQKVLYIWGDPADPKSMGTFGGVPEIRNEMLEYAGAVNAAGGVKERWPMLNQEQVIAWNPDVVVVWGWADRLEPVHFLDNPDWQTVQAVQDGRVYKLPRWSSWSPPEVIMVLQMAQWFYPDRYSDLSVEQWKQELLQEFYRL